MPGRGRKRFRVCFSTLKNESRLLGISGPWPLEEHRFGYPARGKMPLAVKSTEKIYKDAVRTSGTGRGKGWAGCFLEVRRLKE